jgi:D-lactate dehydrogenase
MCLFSPTADALIPLRSRATPERAPKHLAVGTPPALRDDLISLFGSVPVLSRVTDLGRYATDVEPAEQIAAILQYARQNHHSITFGRLGVEPEWSVAGRRHPVDVRKCFVGLEAPENGRLLLPYKRVLGPDPTTTAAG